MKKVRRKEHMMQYRDYHTNRLLTPEEGAVWGSYYKDHLVKGVLRKTEQFFQDGMQKVTYYKETDEQPNQIIALYSNLSTVNEIFIRAREPYGSFTIEQEQWYLRNKQTGLFELQSMLINWLYDVKGNILGTKHLNLACPPRILTVEQ